MKPPPQAISTKAGVAWLPVVVVLAVVVLATAGLFSARLLCARQAAPPAKEQAPEPDAEWPTRVLEESISAPYRLTFAGRRETELYRDGYLVKSYRQSVAARQGLVRWEVLAPQAEKGRTTLYTREELWEYYPDRRRLVVSPFHAEAACEQQGTELLRRYHTGVISVIYEGETQSLGRPVYVLVIVDNLQRPARRYWVDQATFLPLAREDYDDNGAVLLSARFSDLDFAVLLPDSAFAPPKAPPGCRVVRVSGQEAAIPLKQAEEQAGFTAFLPSYIPRGYGLLRDQAAVVEVGGVHVLWLRYCDGADRLSLFEVPKAQFARLKADGDWDYAWANSSHGFLLLGPVDQATVAQIKQSTLSPPPPATSGQAKQEGPP